MEVAQAPTSHCSEHAVSHSHLSKSDEFVKRANTVGVKYHVRCMRCLQHCA